MVSDSNKPNPEEKPVIVPMNQTPVEILLQKLDALCKKNDQSPLNDKDCEDLFSDNWQ